MRPTVTAAGCTTLAAGMKALALYMGVIDGERAKKGRGVRKKAKARE